MAEDDGRTRAIDPVQHGQACLSCLDCELIRAELMLEPQPGRPNAVDSIATFDPEIRPPQDGAKARRRHKGRVHAWPTQVTQDHASTGIQQARGPAQRRHSKIGALDEVSLASGPLEEHPATAGPLGSTPTTRCP